MGNSASVYIDPDDDSTIATRGIEWAHASDFEVLFGTQPDVLQQCRKGGSYELGSMRKLSHATPLNHARSAAYDADCVFADLLRKVMDYQRAQHSHPSPALPLTFKMSQLLETDTDCPVCKNISRNLRPGGLPHKDLDHYEQNYGHENLNIHLRGPTISVHESPGWRLAELLPVKDDRGEPGQNYPALVQFLAIDLTEDYSMQKIARWLQDCQVHAKCKKEMNHVLPSRILDVGTSSTPYTRLRITSDDERGKYAALSYCWGGYTGLMLKQHNMADFQGSIDENFMPKTYRDAILLCRRLDIRYLWIDALCILQDSRPDWELENPRMADVYGNAYLTISASSASSATQGFLSPRDAIDVTSVLIGTISHHEETFPVYLSEPLLENIRSIELHIKDEPLTSRAWALQERMLSQRVVHFASKGMIWQCRQKTINEDGMSFSTDVMMVPYMEDFKSPLLEWYRSVDRFSECAMTNPTDCFPAFAGITKAFERFTGDTYYFGHPKSNFVQSLGWGSAERAGDEALHLAPSWSWASRKRCAKLGDTKVGDPEINYVARILSWPKKCQVADLDEVRDAGRFTMITPTVNARIHRPADPERPLWEGGCHAYLEGCSVQPISLGISFPDMNAPDGFDISCVLAVLYLWGGPEEAKEPHGLVLVYADEERKDLKRVGTWQAVDEKIGPVQAVLKERELTII